MRHYPRAWNRFLCFLVGLILLVGGVALALVQFWPTAREYWLQYGPQFTDTVTDLLDRTGIIVAGHSMSWVSLIVVAVMVVFAIILLATIFGQSGGKTREALNIDAADMRHLEDFDDAAAGTITFTTKFMDEYVRDHLEDEPGITSVAVSNWKVKNDTALQLKIRVTRGASPMDVYAAVNRLSSDLDSLLQRPLPIMVRLLQGNAISQSFGESAPRVE